MMTDQEYDILRKGLLGVKRLIDDSYGVDGYHFSGRPAPWEEFRAGGENEDYLVDFDKALELIDQSGGEK